MRYYNLHNLIAIVVHDGVRREVVDAVELQNGFFRCDQLGANIARRVEVRRYDQWSVPPGETESMFHLYGAGENCLNDPNRKVAYRKTMSGYQVYAEAPTFLINLLLQFLLVECDASLVHAAAVCDQDGAVTLLPGPGESAKQRLSGTSWKNVDTS